MLVLPIALRIPILRTFASLVVSLAFTFAYLGVLGHLRRDAIDPYVLTPLLVIAAAVAVSVGGLFMRSRVGASQRSDLSTDARRAIWLALPLRSAIAMTVAWLVAGAGAIASALALGVPPDAVDHLIPSALLVPAAITGWTAYFVVEQAVRRHVELHAPQGHVARTRARLRFRLVLTLITISIAPVLVLANAIAHLDEHRPPADSGPPAHDHDTSAEGHAHGSSESPSLFLLVVVVGGAAGLAGLRFGLLAATSLSEPLRRLTDGMEMLRSGDSSARAAVLSTDELGRAAETFNEMADGLVEREWLRETFGRYVSKEVVDVLREGRLALGGEVRVVSILFADIRGFTRMSEQMSPAEVLEFVNSYLRRMIAAVSSRRGRLDKVMGDGMMVVFGAPLDDLDHARHALEAALEMRRVLAELNTERAARGESAIRIGIGVHSGEVIAGNVGCDEHKLEYTVLGDAVNLASRIESLTKELDVDLLATDDTIRAAGDGFQVRAMGESQIRGKQVPIKTFYVESHTA